MQISSESILTFLSQILPELIGAGVGAFLGYYYGVRQDRKMRREEEIGRKNAVVKSLLTELADIKSVLDRGLSGRIIVYPGHPINYLEPLLTTDSFDSVVFSGSYQMLKIETQRKLTWFFKGCKIMNELGMQLEYREFNKNGAIEMKFHIQKQYGGLKEGLNDVIKSLQSELDSPFEITLVRN